MYYVCKRMRKDLAALTGPAGSQKRYPRFDSVVVL